MTIPLESSNDLPHLIIGEKQAVVVVGVYIFGLHLVEGIEAVVGQLGDVCQGAHQTEGLVVEVEFHLRRIDRGNLLYCTVL